jgi:protein O-GlcNAc transferase
MGLLSIQTQRPDIAVEFLRRAIAINPTDGSTYINLGKAFEGLGQLDDAIAAWRKSLELRPNADAAFNLGLTLHGRGQLNDAIVAYRQALELKSDHPEAYIALGNALNSTSQFAEAAQAYQHAIRLKPDYAEAYNNLGIALKNMGQLDQAIAAYHQALRLKPQYVSAHTNLGNVLGNIGELDAAIAAFRRVLELKPEFSAAQSNLLFTLHFHPDYSAARICDEHRRWNEQQAKPLARFIQPHRNDRSPDRRLKIAYVSPDLRDHVLAFTMIPVFSNHDHEQFELCFYANVASPDAITQRIHGHADLWRSTMGMDDTQIAAQVRQDQIDILIDAAMHMSRSRPLVFAQKPAPIQVAWLAYPGTTGLSTMDYRLTDPFIDPPGLNDQFYSEKSIRLPNSFWCYDPLTTRPAINDLPATKNGYLTFGCLNNFCKINDQVLRLWARVLKTVSNSQLILLCPEGHHRQKLLDTLRACEISPDRIELVSRRPRDQYLETYHRIDIGLDSLPYNGHTTSLDSFWMGVPVVTLVGQTVVGRAGSSQLANLGLTELIAQTPDQYVQIAADLARDLPRLAEYRSTLRTRMQTSPLMDAPRFTRNLEAAYRQMWREWCETTAVS